MTGPEVIKFIRDEVIQVIDLKICELAGTGRARRFSCTSMFNQRLKLCLEGWGERLEYACLCLP